MSGVLQAPDLVKHLSAVREVVGVLVKNGEQTVEWP